MNTLWTFGDSLTFGFGCREDGPLTEYFYNYKKNGDDIWPVLLSNMLGLKLKNMGKCSASNDYIFDTIIKNFDSIKLGDYVILGKTLHQRFDIKNPMTGDFYHIAGHFGEKDIESKFNDVCKSEEESETLVNFLYFFAHDPIFKKRQDLRFDFIKNRLINERKIFKYLEWRLGDDFTKKIEKIRDHTKNKINDGHFSFNGHKQISEHFYRLIKEPKSLI